MQSDWIKPAAALPNDENRNKVQFRLKGKISSVTGFTHALKKSRSYYSKIITGYYDDVYNTFEEGGESMLIVSADDVKCWRYAKDENK